MTLYICEFVLVCVCMYVCIMFYQSVRYVCYFTRVKRAKKVNQAL